MPFETENNSADAPRGEVPASTSPAPQFVGAKVGELATDQKPGEPRQRQPGEHDELLDRLRLQFERMPIACVIGDPELRIVDWNPAAEETFGYRKEEIVGLLGYVLNAPANYPFLREIHQRLRSGDMAANGLSENLTKDGRIILCQWRNTPLLDANGKVIAIMSMAQDVTEAMRTQEKL